MTVHTRVGTFETNSSSSHSLTITHGELIEQPFSQQELRDGAIHVYVGEYGWEWYRYYSAREKINYLITDIFSPHGSFTGDENDFNYLNDEDRTKELRNQFPNFDMICKVVEDFTGCSIIVDSFNNGYIDHDSVGTSHDAFASEDALKDFLFGKTSYLETGNDNSGPGWTIDSDKGREDVFINNYAEVPENAVEHVCKCSDWPQELKFEKAIVQVDSDHGKNVISEGVVTEVIVVRSKSRAEWDGRYRSREDKADIADILSGLGYRFLKDFKVIQQVIADSKDSSKAGIGDKSFIIKAAYTNNSVINGLA